MDELYDELLDAIEDEALRFRLDEVVGARLADERLRAFRAGIGAANAPLAAAPRSTILRLIEASAIDGTD